MNNMKRFLAIVLALAMIFALAACGQKQEESEGGKESGRNKDSKNTPAPEFVYKANYQTLNGGNKSQQFYPTLVTQDAFYCINNEVVGQRELEENETLEWEGQLDIYENRLYRLGVDGSMEKLEQYRPIQFEPVEGHEIGGGINGMAILPGGGFLTWENQYDSWSEAGDDVEMYSDEWYNSWKYEERYFIRTLDENGKELSCVEMDVDEMKQNQDYVYFNGMAPVGDHQALMAGEGGLYIYDTETGKMTGRIGGIDWVEKLLTLKDGRVAVVYYGDNGQKLSVVDVEKGALGEDWSVQGDLYQAIAGSGEYDLYYNNGVNFYGYKLDEGKAEKLFNWINCDVDNSNINGYTVTADGKIVALSNEWDENYENVTSSLITMEKVPASTLPQKEVITLACQYLAWETRSEIIKFNRSHDDVRIELRDYSEYNSDDDYEAGLTKLRTEMLAGNCPDIIDLSSMPAKQLAAKGLLTDLYPLLDADPELSREDFFPSVLKAMENNGKLYSTCSGFEVISAVGASKVVGSEPGWTYQQLTEALREMPEGCTVFSVSETRSDILRMCLTLEMDNFVNWNTGEVNFDKPEFIEMLNFVKSFPAEFDWEHYEWSDEDDDMLRVREGRQLLVYGDLSNFDSISQYESAFGGLDGFTFVGFPTSRGVGSMIMTSSGYGICETCRNKQAAWDFVRTFMTEEYQDRNSYAFPSNIHSYEAKKTDAMTPVYQKDDEGHIMLDPETGEKMMESKGGYWDSTAQEWVNSYYYTQEEIDKIESVIMSADRAYTLDEAINDIVNEQVEAFFAGQRSAEDVAKLIQSKAKIYVNEQR